MDCIHPVRIQKNLDPGVFPHGVEVACGKCHACRISQRREWTVRVLHELSITNKGLFITLTYDDEHLPFNKDWTGTPSIDPSLRKQDLQLYFKRLRKSLGDRKIKYYACGEYGELNERPHYHAIITNMDLRDPDDVESIDNNWQMGITHVGAAEFDSIQYVAGYIDKKLSGPLAHREYDERGRSPVFRLISNGIGKDFAIANQEQFKQQLCVSVRGQKINLPRYYVDKLSIDKEELKKRSDERDRARVLEQTGLELSSSELLFSEHNEKKSKYFQKRAKDNRQKARNLRAKFMLKQRDFQKIEITQ